MIKIENDNNEKLILRPFSDDGSLEEDRGLKKVDSQSSIISLKELNRPGKGDY